MKFLFIPILCIAVLSSVAETSLAVQLPHTDPENSGNWELQSQGSDEFDDGTIDTAKWHVQGTGGEYFNGWKGRAPSQFIPEAVSQRDGKLLIQSKWDEDYPFVQEKDSGRYWYGYADAAKQVKIPLTTGALISKSYFQNCYLEIRCKVGKSPMSGSFWAVDSNNSGELDVFEHVGMGWDDSRDHAQTPTIMQSSIHTWNPKRPDGNNRIWTHQHWLDFDVSDGYHVYALDWTADSLKFYVDGRLIREVTKNEAQAIQFGPVNAWCVDTAMRIWIDSEIFEWEGDLKKLKPEMFAAATFEVDYLRVWKRKSAGSGKSDAPSENLVVNGNVDQDTQGWKTTGTTSRQDVSKWKFWKDDNTDHQCFQIGPGPARAEQSVAVKPNTTYLLTARLRMPGTTGTYEPVNQRPSPVTWDEGWFGVQADGIGGADSTKQAKVFKNWFQTYSIEFTTGNQTTQATIFFTNKQAGKILHIDDVFLRQLPQMD